MTNTQIHSTNRGHAQKKTKTSPSKRRTMHINFTARYIRQVVQTCMAGLQVHSRQYLQSLTIVSRISKPIIG